MIDTPAPILLLARASVLLCVALGAGVLLRRASATRRHGVWSALFVGLLVLPVLSAALPEMTVSVPAWVASARAEPAVDHQRPDVPTARIELPRAAQTELPVVTTPIVEKTFATHSQPGLELSPWVILWAVWIAGAAVALFILAVSLARVARVTAQGTELDDSEWRAAVDRVAERLGVTGRVRLIASDAVTTPMAGGFVRPTVFLPADANAWSADRRDIVLAHEVAHLAGRDPLRHILTRVAVTLYWFHPLVWVAARKAIVACEQAADEAVLSLGVRPSTYANVLLDFAATAPDGAGVALPIVRPALLETRLMTILDGKTHPTGARRTLAPIAALAALTVCIAAIRPSFSAPLPNEAAPVATSPSVVAAPATASAAVLSSASVASATAELSSAGVGEEIAPTSVMEQPNILSSIETACSVTGSDFESFSGTISMKESNGTSVIYEQSGRRGDARIVQKSFDGLRICALATNVARGSIDRPSGWVGRASRVIYETQRGGELRRMEFNGDRMTWSINGRVQPSTPETEEWRQALLAVLDATWEINELHGRANTLRGEINTIHGERNTLQGEINTLRGEVNTMQGEINTLRGEENTFQGEINTIRGQVNTMQGQINTERGAINTLQGARNSRGADYGDIDARIRRHEARIQEIEAEIRRFDADARIAEVRRRMQSFDVEARVREVERRIRDFDVESRVASVNRRIQGLDVERRVRDIEDDIRALDVEGRTADMEIRRDQALARLRTVIGR